MMYLYLKRMHCSESKEEFYKIGVTKHAQTSKRFSYGATSIDKSDLPFGEIVNRLIAGEKHVPDHPYQVDDIFQVEYTYEGDALIAERDLLCLLRSQSYRPKKEFSGKTECFHVDDNTKDKIVNFMEKTRIK